MSTISIKNTKGSLTIPTEVLEQLVGLELPVIPSPSIRTIGAETCGILHFHELYECLCGDHVLVEYMALFMATFEPDRMVAHTWVREQDGTALFFIPREMCE